MNQFEMCFFGLIVVSQVSRIMKLLILITLLIVGQVIGLQQKHQKVDVPTARSLNSKLKNFLDNDLRYIMRNNEPILDPYISQERLLEYDDGTIIFNGKLNDFVVNNLSNYIVKNSNVNIWSKKVNIELDFPTITSNGFYNFEAHYQNLPYSGNGYYNVTIRDLSFSAEAYIKIIGGVQVKSLNLNIALGGFDFSASNDYFETEEESKVWSTQISQVVPKFIADNHDSIVKFVTPKIIIAINQQLQNNN